MHTKKNGTEECEEKENPLCFSSSASHPENIEEKNAIMFDLPLYPAEPQKNRNNQYPPR